MIVAIASSSGIGISNAKIVHKKTQRIIKYNSKSVDSEMAKLDDCIKAANDELNSLYYNLSTYRGDSTAGVIEKYTRIINNGGLTKDIKDMISEKGVSAEYAVSSILENSRKLIEELDDEYLNEKSGDIEEIKCRLLSQLSGAISTDIKNINEECIIVAEDLTSSDILNMNPKLIKGIVTINGGPTSGFCIMARRMKIPAVIGVGAEGYTIKEGDMLIVDGDNGRVIINPDESKVDLYLKEKQ